MPCHYILWPLQIFRYNNKNVFRLYTLFLNSKTVQIDYKLDIKAEAIMEPRANRRTL